MPGQYGLDINDPQGDPCSAVAAGEDVLGAGAGVHQVRRLRRIKSGWDIGLDLGEERE